MHQKNGDAIPIIDIFAGPGGLGEGFSAFTDSSGNHPFKIALSIEKDPLAHQTLTLRSFFRQFPPREAPAEYYRRLQQKITTPDLFNAFPEHAAAARSEAWRATLGDDAEAPLPELRRRVREALARTNQTRLTYRFRAVTRSQSFALRYRARKLTNSKRP